MSSSACATSILFMEIPPVWVLHSERRQMLCYVGQFASSCSVVPGPAFACNMSLSKCISFYGSKKESKRAISRHAHEDILAYHSTITTFSCIFPYALLTTIYPLLSSFPLSCLCTITDRSSF